MIPTIGKSGFELRSYHGWEWLVSSLVISTIGKSGFELKLPWMRATRVEFSDFDHRQERFWTSKLPWMRVTHVEFSDLDWRCDQSSIFWIFSNYETLFWGQLWFRDWRRKREAWESVYYIFYLKTQF